MRVNIHYSVKLAPSIKMLRLHEKGCEVSKRWGAYGAADARTDAFALLVGVMDCTDWERQCSRVDCVGGSHGLRRLLKIVGTQSSRGDMRARLQRDQPPEGRGYMMSKLMER